MVNMHEFNEDGVWEKEPANMQVMYIVLELVQGGELFDFIAEGGALNEKNLPFLHETNPQWSLLPTQ